MKRSTRATILAKPPERLLLLRERLLFLLDESDDHGAPAWGLDHPFAKRATRAVELIRAALPESPEPWYDAHETHIRALQLEDQEACATSDEPEEAFVAEVQDLLDRLRADYVRAVRVRKNDKP